MRQPSTSISGQDPCLNIAPQTLARFCRRHHIRRLSLFGSQRKGTATAQSDIDLLVEFEPDAHPILVDLAEMEAEPSGALNGRKVDVRTAEDLSPHFRAEVLRTAEAQYVGGVTNGGSAT